MVTTKALRTRRPKLPPRLTTGLRWGIGLAIAAFLLARFNVGDVGNELAQADLRLAAPAIAGLVAVHVIGAATWRTLARRIGGRTMAIGATIRSYYIAQAIGLLTPGNLGADAYRLFAPADGAGGWRDGILPIAVQRITSSVALAVIAVSALALLPNAAEVAPVVVGAAAGLTLASSLVLVVIRRPKGGAAEPSEGPTSGAAAAPTRSRIVLAVGEALVYGLVFHGVSIGLSGVLVVAVAPNAPVGGILACLAIARLSILVPISPSGRGFQEGALSILFMRIGLPPEVALASAALNRVALIGTASTGGALAALPKLRRLACARRPLLAGARADQLVGNQVVGQVAVGKIVGVEEL